MAGRLGTFIIGGIVGAAAALLYAPRTGEETRAYVADKANEAWGNAQNYSSDASNLGQQFYGDAVARGQEMYQNAAGVAQQAYTRATETAQGVFNNSQNFAQVNPTRDSYPTGTSVFHMSVFSYDKFLLTESLLIFHVITPFLSLARQRYLKGSRG